MIMGQVGVASLAAKVLRHLNHEAKARVQTRNLDDEEIKIRDRKVSRQERRHLDRQRRKMPIKEAT
jgi:hypothetical protein